MDSLLFLCEQSVLRRSRFDGLNYCVSLLIEGFTQYI